MKEVFESGITCYTTFFPTTKVILNLDFRRLVIYNEGWLYIGKDDL